MRINDLAKMGIRNLARRKARTSLTVTGVVIGTISIVVMISIGIGMKKNYESGVMQQGSLTAITVEKYQQKYDADGNWIEEKKQKLDDTLVSVFREIDHVKTVTPIIIFDSYLLSGKYQGWGNVMAVDLSVFSDPDFPKPVEGSLPTKDTTSTVVIGSYIPQNFVYYYARGYQTKTLDLTKDKVKLRIGGYQYQVAEKKRPYELAVKDYALLEESQDWEYNYSVIIEMEYFKSIFKQYLNTLKVEDRKKAKSAMESYQKIKITVDNIDNVEEVQEKIKELGFDSTSLAMQLKPMQETANMLQMVLGGIGAISLLVSSINIANTMIMSIYERTKEIGIMKVLGCFVFDIRKLFLFEAAIIGLMGGILGVILSYIASWAINKFGEPLFSSLMSTSYMYNIENSKFSIIPLWLPLLASGIAIAVGLVSGFYPAVRATKISAIEAMKTDG